MCIEIDRVAQAIEYVVILVKRDDPRLQRGDVGFVQVDGVADNDLKADSVDHLDVGLQMV
jgi:hypothetical protein